MTYKEKIIKLIQFIKEDLNKLITCYTVIVCVSMCLYVFNVYMCLEKYIYPHIEQGLVVKTPKCSDVLPLGSGIIDLVFEYFTVF